jgi:hypothetical protein
MIKSQIQPFKAWRLLCVLYHQVKHSGILRSAQTVSTRFVYFPVQTAIIFIYCAVRTGSLNIIRINCYLKRVKLSLELLNIGTFRNEITVSPHLMFKPP